MAILRLKQWARITVLVLSGLSIVNTIYAVITKFHITIPIGEILMLWYFNKEEVVNQFTSRQSVLKE